jgi:XTP/dITP diphosphohydrolase
MGGFFKGRKMKLLIATHNQHKLKEFREILAPLGYEILGADDVGLTDCEETGQTFHENSFQKAKHAVLQTGLPTLADDSGLCIHALDNQPGIFSARFAQENGGYPAVFNVIWQKLEPFSDWSAHFNCCLCLLKPEDIQNPLYFEGLVHGRITKDKDDSMDKFGYDPIFVPDGYDRPFGGLSKDVKNQLSHRARALEKLVAYLKLDNC